MARSKSSVLTDKSERKIRRQSGEFLRLPHLNPSQKRLRRRCAVDSASALATAYPRHTLARCSPFPPLSRCSPVSPQVLWLTCFCFFCCCFYYCCFFLFSQRLRHALPGFSCWRRCCCLLDLPYRLHTVLSLTLSLPFLCSLFPHLCFFSHSFDLQRASSVRRDVCAMPMRCAFEIRFFIRQNICLRTYLCIWGIPGKSFDRNTQCDYYCSCLSKNRVRYKCIYRIQIEAT